MTDCQPVCHLMTDSLNHSSPNRINELRFALYHFFSCMALPTLYYRIFLIFLQYSYEYYNTEQRTLKRATLDSQIITVPLQIVEELKDLFKIKIYIYGKNIKSHGSNNLNAKLVKKGN